MYCKTIDFEMNAINGMLQCTFELEPELECIPLVCVMAFGLEYRERWTGDRENVCLFLQRKPLNLICDSFK